MIKFSFTGDVALAQQLRRAAAENRKQVRRALVELAEEKLKIMQRRVPYKRGKLHDTGRISVRVGAKQISVKFIFGSPEVGYAVKRHEDLSAGFKGGRGPKYAESVLLETNLGEELAAKLSWEEWRAQRAAR